MGVINASSNIGLILNAAKNEIVAINFNKIKICPIFKSFKQVRIENLNLLGSPFLKVPALSNEITELEIARRVITTSLLAVPVVRCFIDI